MTARGRPRKYKKTVRRNISASNDTFDLLSSLGIDYSDVFERGKKAILDELFRPLGVGITTLKRLDILIAEEEEAIENHQKRKSALEEIRTTQSNLLEIPEGDRERQILFKEIAFKHLEPGEIRGYLKAYNAKYEQGENAENIITAIISDIQRRSNGSGKNLKHLFDDRPPSYREALVHNFLVEAVKTLPPEDREEEAV